MAGLETQAAALEAQSSAPGFWDDPQSAQDVMKRLSGLRQRIDTWRGLEAQVRDLLELVELARAEDDAAIAGDIARDADDVERRLGALEFELAFSGPYDDRNAIIAIHAGAGGTESQDWAEMLLRMYLRWCERRGFPAEVIDLMPGEEAGIKSATVEVTGAHAYGNLKSERGVHRLVRLSPFDSAHARHTSFALVEVLPEAGDAAEVRISADDIRVDVFRASGHGGQNVQKNSTAIRITHLPTGIVVTCQNERSQHRNRESAMRVLEARLIERELERHADEQARIKGEHVSAGWSNQIRSYVLHPYKMVKDHRTGYETSDAAGVLEGDLDPIIQAYLKSQVGQDAA
ncbi:MAG: peptide chain release factor 2 [Chloroflexota bacterium]|nr:peptide chain release factor 2 [Chloroflexota bacterium]